MNVSKPLDHPCPHLATPQEQERDPEYRACGAPAGQTCTWARRHDGFGDPPFHSERLESACNPGPVQNLAPALLREAILESGLV